MDGKFARHPDQHLEDEILQFKYITKPTLHVKSPSKSQSSQNESLAQTLHVKSSPSTKTTPQNKFDTKATDSTPNKI
jgi:hypothetical protein